MLDESETTEFVIPLYHYTSQTGQWPAWY